MSLVSLMGLLLCSQCTVGLGKPADTVHSRRTRCPVLAITLLLRPGLNKGISVGSRAAHVN